MVKASEKEKPVVASPISPEEAAGNRSFRTCAVLPALEALVAQFDHLPARMRRDFSFFGPADALLRFMVENRGGVPDGLPLAGEELLAYLQEPEIARKIRLEGKVVVSVEQNPGEYRPGPTSGAAPRLQPKSKTQMLIRLERIPVEADQALTG